MYIQSLIGYVPFGDWITVMVIIRYYGTIHALFSSNCRPAAAILSTINPTPNARCHLHPQALLQWKLAQPRNPFRSGDISIYLAVQPVLLVWDVALYPGRKEKGREGFRKTWGWELIGNCTYPRCVEVQVPHTLNWARLWGLMNHLCSGSQPLSQGLILALAELLINLVQ